MTIQRVSHLVWIAVLGLWGSWAAAQTFDATLGSDVGAPGDFVSVPVVLDSSAGLDVEGGILAICHDDTLLLTTDVQPGAALATVNGGLGPEVFVANLTPGLSDTLFL